MDSQRQDFFPFHIQIIGYDWPICAHGKRLLQDEIIYIWGKIGITFFHDSLSTEQIGSVYREIPEAAFFGLNKKVMETELDQLLKLLMSAKNLRNFIVARNLGDASALKLA